MNRSEEYRKLYRSSFKDDAVWLDWMMRQVYNDEDVMMLDDENHHPVSALLLRSYTWLYMGSRLDLSYIYGACTLPRARSHGYMGRLIDDSLRYSLERGDALCSLIPASESLYYYYARYGFAKAVYTDRELYTAVHRFDVADGLTPVEPDYEAFNRLEADSDNTVLHTRKDYTDILDDLNLDGGEVFAISNGERTVAMAFAVPTDDNIRVKAIFADNDAAKDAALAGVRERFGDKMIVADCFVGRRKRALQPRGMVRILDCYQIFNAMAASQPDLRCTVRVRDHRIAGNNDRFTLADGICRRGGGSADLDVDVDTLARILGSSEAVGRIMQLKTTHFRLPLMLD